MTVHARAAPDGQRLHGEPGAAAGRLRPFVKWAGGKGQLLSHIRPVVPSAYDRYIEPFLGGGAVYIDLQPDTALLGDCNQELVEGFEAVRDDLPELMPALDRHVAAAGTEDAGRRDHYYRVRALDPSLLSAVERAARFVYLNKTCYNGLYRVNRAGRFNVPFGRHTRHPQVYDPANLEGVSLLLQRARLHCADFEKTLHEAGSGDFVYVDPPYDPLSTTANFTGYTAQSFGWPEQERLAAAVREAGRRGARVLLNNSDTPAIRTLYDGFNVWSVPSNRSINSDPGKRRGAQELIITNY